MGVYEYWSFESFLCVSYDYAIVKSLDSEPGLGVDGPCGHVNITDLFIISYVGLFYTIVAHCCHVDTGCRPVPDQVKPSFVILTVLSIRVPVCQKLLMTA